LTLPGYQYGLSDKKSAMKRILFILLLPLSAFAQKVVITGELTDCQDSMDIFIYKPVGAYANSCWKQREGKVAAHTFLVTIPLEVSGVITIENNCLQSALFVSPGDSVHIERNATGSIYKGSNAAGHNLLNNNKVPFNVSLLNETITHLMDTVQSPGNAIWGIRALIIDYKAPLLTLLRTGEITVTFYEHMVALMECNVMSQVMNQLSLKFEHPEQQSAALKKATLKQLSQDLDGLYDAFDTKYQSCPGAVTLITRKCNFIEKGYLKGNIISKDLSQHYNEQYQYFAYAPLPLQEMMAGNALMTNLVNHTTPVNTQTKLFSYFKSIFPQSVYLPVIQQMLDNPAQ
jgi:hypothetical protein